jgi:high-affinity iron transporter
MNYFTRLRMQTQGLPLMKFAIAVAKVTAFLLVLGVLMWQCCGASENPNPPSMRPGSSASMLDIGVLVFREGLECILVLAAITAGMSRSKQGSGTAVATGVAIGFIATLLTWFGTVHMMNDLSKHVSTIQLQASTGLLAIFVLLIVMNWFFHKLYWTGWISVHNKRKQFLIQQSATSNGSRAKLFWGMALLGFSSLYREGVEVVLFLQSYRLRVGGQVLLRGVAGGLVLTSAVGVLSFVLHRKLPYKRLLVVTGVLLGAVLLVMVGEQVQEMQLAGWLSTTELPLLTHLLPPWTGAWFSTFPNVQGLLAQFLAAIIVLGSYLVAQKPKLKHRNDDHIRTGPPERGNDATA